MILLCRNLDSTVKRHIVEMDEEARAPTTRMKRRQWKQNEGKKNVQHKTDGKKRPKVEDVRNTWPPKRHEKSNGCISVRLRLLLRVIRKVQYTEMKCCSHG